MGLQLGDPISVESTLTDEDYAKSAKKYPSVFTKGSKKPRIFDCDFKWRYRMGMGMPEDEITLFNLRLAELHKLLSTKKVEVVMDSV